MLRINRVARPGKPGYTGRMAATTTTKGPASVAIVRIKHEPHKRADKLAYSVWSPVAGDRSEVVARFKAQHDAEDYAEVIASRVRRRRDVAAVQVVGP